MFVKNLTRHALSLVSVLLLLYAFFLFLPLENNQRSSIRFFLPLHTAMETFSVVISCMIFGIIWNTVDRKRAASVDILGISFLSVGLLDFAHLLSYQGMPVFVSPNSPQKAIVFWLAARLVAALSMLIAAVMPLKPADKSKSWHYLFISLLITALVYWIELAHPEWLPMFWQDGLSQIKVYIELVLIGIYSSVALMMYWRYRQLGTDTQTQGLLLAASVMAISELCFASYIKVDDTLNFLGHIYKIIAYFFLYQVLFVQFIHEPYRLLEATRQEIWLQKERAEVTLQSIMDGVITTDASGYVVSINSIASRLTGYSSPSAVGQPISHIFKVIDETSGIELENPVEQCLRERNAVLLANHALLISAFKQVCAIEQLASPIVDRQGNIIGVIMVFRDVTERRHAQDTIRRNEQRLREAQTMAKMGNWEWDIQKNQIEWSDEIKKLFNIKNLQLDYEGFLAFLHTEDKEKVKALVEKVLQGDEVYDIEYRIVYSNEQIRYVHAKAQVEFDALGKPIKMVGIAQDISEPKLAEEQLRNSYKVIEDLYNYAPCGYHSLDNDGVIQRINQTELDWLGYDREDVVGKMALTDFMTNDSVKRFHQYYPELKRQGFINDVELELIRKDGSHFFVSLNATIIYDLNGQFVMTRSTLFDITERRIAQTELMKKEEILRRAQTIAHVGSWEWDILGGQQVWSDESYRIFGLDKVTSQGSYDEFMNLVVPEDRALVTSNVQAALYASSCYVAEYRIKRPTGEIRYISSQAELVRNELGRPVRMIGTNFDITERKLIEIELRDKEAEQRKQTEMRTAIFDALPVNLVVINAEGGIVFINRRWRDFALENGLLSADYGIGANYLHVCEFVESDTSIAETLNGLRRILSGELDQFVTEYPCHSAQHQRWFRMIAVPLAVNKRLGAVIIHIDSTESWQYIAQMEALIQELKQQLA